MPEPHFCKYCGSTSSSKVTINENMSHTRDSSLRGGASFFGGSHGRSNSDGTSFSYPGYMCNFCKNQGPSIFNDDEPIETSPISDLSIIIPSNLKNMLESSSLQISDFIYEIIQTKQRIFRKVLQHFEREGKNDCTGHRVGAKLNVRYHEKPLDMYLAVEIIRQNIFYRIIYGGGKVPCLE